MTLGQRIAHYRKALGLSQEALADQVGVSRQAVSKWELDEAQPDAAKIVLLAQALGVSTDQLLLGDPGDPEEPQSWDGDAGAAPPPPRQDYPALLAGFIHRHGYKAGYLLIAYGALLLLVAAVMFFIIRGFFGAAVQGPAHWGDYDHSYGEVQFSLAPGVSLSPDEIDAIEQQIGHGVHGGDWHEYEH